MILNKGINMIKLKKFLVRCVMLLLLGDLLIMACLLLDLVSAIADGVDVGVGVGVFGVAVVAGGFAGAVAALNERALDGDDKKEIGGNYDTNNKSRCKE